MKSEPLDNLELHSALEKIRATGDGSVVELTPDETKALRDYLTLLAAKADRTESEEILCRHIRGVLQGLAVAARRVESDDAATRRSNLALRAAIDRFVGRHFSEVDATQVEILQATQARLEEMAQDEEPSPNQLRLKQLIDDCLGAYERWRAEGSMC